MNLLEELKRRNVFRAGLAYLVTVWLILQIADVVLPNIGTPDWVFRALMLALALGLLPTLLFSWAYELTPEGLKREHEVDRSRSITGETARKLDLVTISVVIMALGVLATDRLFSGPRETQSLAPDHDDEIRIAVLPFIDMSGEPGQEYFSDGISEELLNLLTNVPGFWVVGRTSSFAFRGTRKNLQDIGRQLGVSHVLEGSVRKAGNRLRITAQLVQVDNGFQLWSETYDRELTDIFAVQDDIAAALVSELRTTLLGEIPPGHGDKALTSNADAYLAYRQGKSQLQESGPENFRQAADSFRQAIALAPESGLAWAGLAMAEIRYSSQTAEGYEQSLAEARTATARAMELGENLPEAHLAHAALNEFYDWDWQALETSLQRALKLRPGDLEARMMLADARSIQGDAEAALTILRDIARSDPLNIRVRAKIGRRLLDMGRYEEAEEIFRGMYEKAPERPLVKSYLAWTLVGQGELEEALALFSREPMAFLRLQGLATVYHLLDRRNDAESAQQQLLIGYGNQGAYQQALIHAQWGALDTAARWLQTAFDTRDPGMENIKRERLLVPLHDHPVYQSLLRRMNLDN